MTRDGALVASLLFPKLGIHIGTGLVSEKRKKGPPENGWPPFLSMIPAVAASRYSTISTIRRLRGSTRTVRPFTTV